MSFGEHMYAFLSGVYPGVEWFDKSMCMCSVLVDTAQPCSGAVTRDFVSSHISWVQGEGCRGGQAGIRRAGPASECRLNATVPSRVPLLLPGGFLSQGPGLGHYTPRRGSWPGESAVLGLRVKSLS